MGYIEPLGRGLQRFFDLQGEMTVAQGQRMPRCLCPLSPDYRLTLSYHQLLDLEMQRVIVPIGNGCSD